VPIELIFESHSTTVDNEEGRATGWLPGSLSDAGLAQAAELGTRHAGEQIAAVFCSDLARAAQTAAIAFGDSGLPVLHDWRLRECDYGEFNGLPAAQVHSGRAGHLDVPYPGGESWRQALGRIGWFLRDLPPRWAGQRLVVIGHVATRWGLDHHIGGTALEDLADADFAWQPGRHYRLP
jgi:2,3-bisphosphoglycerate-dependent phosphoglycerate mutase